MLGTFVAGAVALVEGFATHPAGRPGELALEADFNGELIAILPGLGHAGAEAHHRLANECRQQLVTDLAPEFPRVRPTPWPPFCR